MIRRWGFHLLSRAEPYAGDPAREVGGPHRVELPDSGPTWVPNFESGGTEPVSRDVVSQKLQALAERVKAGEQYSPYLDGIAQGLGELSESLSSSYRVREAKVSALGRLVIEYYPFAESDLGGEVLATIESAVSDGSSGT